MSDLNLSGVTGLHHKLNLSGIYSLYNPKKHLLLNKINTYSPLLFRVMIVTTNSLRSFTIPMLDGYIYDYTVNWGDGTSSQVTSWNDSNATHTYSSNHEFIIDISGTCETYYFTTPILTDDHRLTIKTVLQWGNVGLKKLRFMGARNMKSVPNDKIGGLSLITDFTYTFWGCQSLFKVHEGVFSHAINATTFNFTFNGNFALTSVPENLFKYNTLVQYFQNTFDQAGLTTIPENLFKYNTNVDSFFGVFGHVPIQHIPANLFSHNVNVTLMGALFYSCTNLIDIPETLFKNNINTESFTLAFDGCTGLTAIPPLLFNTNIHVSSFAGVFRDCRTLTEIPTHLFDTSIFATHFYWAFAKCINISAIPSSLFTLNTVASLMEGVFSGCTSLTTIPPTLFTTNTQITKASYAFECCTSLTSIPHTLFDPCIASGKLNELKYTFHNCTSLTGDGPDWWFNCTGPDYYPPPIDGYMCFSGDTTLSNYENIPTYWGGLGIGVDNRFMIELTTTTGDKTFTIPMLSGYIYNYTVDWGDGSAISTITSWDDLDAIHTYASVLAYTVIIKGTCESFYSVGSTANALLITKVLSWGNVGIKKVSFQHAVNMTSIPTDTIGGLVLVTDFDNTFNACTSLASIPTGLFDYCVDVTSFDSTFFGCLTLTSIPSSLFSNNTLVTNFTYTFYNCNNISTIPNTLFTNNVNVTDFSYTFTYLPITSIPSGLFETCTEVTTFYGTFMECRNLLNIPGVLFYYNSNVTNFTSTFSYCVSLTGITVGIFNTCINVVNFNSTFNGCEILTLIPDGLFDSNIFATDFSYTFSTCYNLPSIPANLFKYNTLVTNFSSVFNACESLTTIENTLFYYNTLVTDFSYAFNGCITLVTIPADFFNNNMVVVNFSYTFNECASVTSYAPEWWLRCPGAYETTLPDGYMCFRNCTNTENYSYIPTYWGGLGMEPGSNNIQLINIVTDPYYIGDGTGYIMGDSVLYDKILIDLTNYIEWTFQGISYYSDNYWEIKFSTICNYPGVIIYPGFYSTIEWQIRTRYNDVVNVSGDYLIAQHLNNTSTLFWHHFFGEFPDNLVPNEWDVQIWSKLTGTTEWQKMYSFVDSPRIKWQFYDRPSFGRLRFSAYNVPRPMPFNVYQDQHSVLEWETRDISNNRLDAGYLFTGAEIKDGIDVGHTVYPITSNGSITTNYDTIWGRVMGSGEDLNYGTWVKMYPVISLPTSRYNNYRIIYTTHSGYVSTDESISATLKKQVDNFMIEDLGTLDIPFVTSVRPAVVIVNNNNFDMSGWLPTGLTYYIDTNYKFTSINSHVVNVSGNLYKKDFDLVLGSTPLPTLGVSVSEMWFNMDKTPIGTSTLTITADKDWYAICPSWVSMSQYWGSGHTTYDVTITVDDAENLPDDISIYDTTNQTPKICTININEYYSLWRCSDDSTDYYTTTILAHSRLEYDYRFYSDGGYYYKVIGKPTTEPIGTSVSGNWVVGEYGCPI